MREQKKESRRPYSFLLDRDVAKAAGLFPPKKTYTMARLELSDTASDAEIVATAWDRDLTIVTSNGDHFITEIHRFQKQRMIKVCHELRGLVILPNAYEDQQRLVPQIRRKLHFEGRKVSFQDVSEKNLCIRVRRDGSLLVTQFPQCFYCQKRRTRER